MSIRAFADRLIESPRATQICVFIGGLMLAGCAGPDRETIPIDCVEVVISSEFPTTGEALQRASEKLLGVTTPQEHQLQREALGPASLGSVIRLCNISDGSETAKLINGTEVMKMVSTNN